MTTTTRDDVHRPPRRRRAVPMLLAPCIVLVLVLASVGSAEAATSPVTARTDSRQVSFAGTAFASQTNESVDVAGNLRVTSVLVGSPQTGWLFAWYTNVADATATGETSGDRYRASGTDGGVVLMPAGPPVRSVALAPRFNLYPPGSPTHPPSPCRLLVNVQLDDAGRVTTVGVHVDPGTFGSAD